MGLRLSVAKTLITHIDDGLDFLGWRIHRHRKRGTTRTFVYTYPSKQALRAVTAKVKAIGRQVGVNQPLDELLRRLAPALRGWCTYFRSGSSSATFSYLSHYVWQTVWRWIRRKHRRSGWKELRRQYCHGGWWPTGQTLVLFDPETVGTTRYRYRGAIIPSPWPATDPASPLPLFTTGLVESPVHERCTPGSGSGPRKRTGPCDRHRASGRLHRPPQPLIIGFIEKMRGEGHAVESICRVLREQGCQIAARIYRAMRSGQRGLSARTVTDAQTVEAIRQVAFATDTYGRRRLAPEGLSMGAARCSPSCAAAASR